MELVLLQDVQNSFASNWARVANTSGLSDIQIKDRFREQGFGAGHEELEVEGVDISKVGGFSRLYFRRAANATQPEVHRLGAVFEQVGIAAEGYAKFQLQPDSTLQSEAAAVPEVIQETASSNAASAFAPLKKRGRPIGSKNKAKEAPLPVGFE